MIESQMPPQSTLPAPIAASARPRPIPVILRLVPLLGGGGALLLAGLAESIVERQDTSILSLVLYLAAIALFAVSAWPLPPAPADQARTGPAAEQPTPPARRRIWAVLGGGTALAFVLYGIATVLLRQDLKAAGGAWLWVVSLAALLATGVVAGRMQGWAPRWAGGGWPADGRGRALLIGALLLIVAGAAAARFLNLDKIPLGVKADEGDRAAVAISIIRGTTPEGFFGTGWYWISMVYFTILSWWLQLTGIGFVQAREFHGLASMITLGTITLIGIRHFGLRVGLLAGALLTLLGVALQFGRLTTEAGPTAMLWTISMALFLEAARRGHAWAWIGAGLAGGFSIYFYPTGRLWAVLAALFCLYLVVHGLGGHRAGIIRGTALAALAAVMVITPFFLNGLAHTRDLTLESITHTEVFTLRAQETSIFTGDNVTRLPYYQPGWDTAQLLTAQIVHSVGAFNQFPSGGDVWPIDRPLMSGLLAVLTLLGLGWICLRPRDPRFVALALWFWVGFAGVVVTVDTPDVQRMATAVPVLALLPALVLDNLARRVEVAVGGRVPRPRPAVAWAASGLAALVLATLLWGQWTTYFIDYAAKDHWMHPTMEGQAVAAQGSDTLVVTVARQEHMVNSGWVRLLAPETPRGGLEAPGANLPLVLPADHNLAFMLFPRQGAFLPYLQGLYPGGATQTYTHPTEGLMFNVYRLPQAAWAATQGAQATPPQGPPVHVGQLGQAPPGWPAYPSPMHWTAGLFVPQYWNYSIRIGPGPARLTVDGDAVLDVPAGTPVLSTTLALARGDHAIAYDGTLPATKGDALFEWALQPEADPNGQGPAPALAWHPVAAGSLVAGQEAPRGLYGLVQIADRPDQHRLDGAIATGALSTEIHSDGHPYTATWTGALLAPATGVYSMTLFAQGQADLTLDGQPVIAIPGPGDQLAGGSITLSAGPHAVQLVYRVTDGPGGLEWAWTPPDGVQSIVPPAALAPPPHVASGPPVPPAILGKREFQPLDPPLNTVR